MPGESEIENGVSERRGWCPHQPQQDELKFYF
jgi:hypothetical protein